MANGPSDRAITKAATLASAVRAVKKTCESPERWRSISRSIGPNQLTSHTSIEPDLSTRPIGLDVMHFGHSVTPEPHPGAVTSTAGVSPGAEVRPRRPVCGFCYEADDWSD